MKIKLTEITNILNILSEYVDKKLPMTLSYKIMKVINVLEPELQFFQNKFNSLVQEFAEKDEDGNIVYTNDGENVQLQKDKIDEFNGQYKELTEMEVDIEKFEFTLKELESLEISPKELFALSPFIRE